ncbi:retrovirus-related pol polyprotein from transposon TNT 1-94 [Tanacetum coccineum]
MHTQKYNVPVPPSTGVNKKFASRKASVIYDEVLSNLLGGPYPKPLKHKSWLWHRRLNHLNFGTINDLARKDLVRGLPRLKFEKDHLCSACQLGKSKKHTHTPKTENTNLEVLNTLHMDLCGPMRVQTINGKKYILTLYEYYESVGIFHQKTVPRTPQQNGVVERWNRTLVEAARTMLIFSKAPMFLWSEAVSTAFTTTPKPVPLFSTKLALHDKNPHMSSVLSKSRTEKLLICSVLKDCWFQAMQDEIHEFDRLDVWELVPPPDSAMIIALKWIYKLKEEVYVTNPEGFVDPERPQHVYRLKKALYGIRNSSPGPARYPTSHTKKHIKAVKRVFRYLQGTINMGLWYLKDTAMALTAYADTDHAGCQDTCRSTSGSA